MPPSGAKREPPLGAVLHLIGRFGASQACAIGPQLALSAAHVTDERPFDKDVPLYPLRWSGDDGASGLLVPMTAARDRDLAFFCSDGQPFSKHAEKGIASPKAGERVWVVGYDWRDMARAFDRRVWTSRVTRVVATHVILESPAELGASGSCVFDESGHAIGIYSWNTPVGGRPEARVGVAVGIWGDLIPPLECPPIKAAQ